MLYKTPNFSFLCDSPTVVDCTLPDIQERDIYHIGDVKEGGYVIDIGANIGLFSLRCATELNCSVLAVEPDPGNYANLCANIAMNNNKCVNPITSVMKAISYFDGPCSFNSRADYSAGSHLGVHYEQKDARVPSYFTETNKDYGKFNCISVQCITLKNLFKEYSVKYCDFMKLDCEGAEYFIFQEDNVDLFRNQVGRLAFECHSEDNSLYVRFLERIGYEVNSPNYTIGSVIHATNKAAHK